MTWDKTDFYFQGDKYLDALIGEINSAKSSIEFEVYIFEDSPVGQRILTALGDAVDRGLRVRLMVDGFGSLLSIPAIEAQCLKRGIEFRTYNKLPFQKGWLTLVNPLSIIFILFSLLRYNKRNHRKVVIIDGQIAFVGSYNISPVHFAEYVGNKAWQDLAVRVQGLEVSLLRKSFGLHWSGKKFFLLPESLLVRVNSSFIQRYRHWRDLLRRIRTAQERVWIMNAYFIPRRSLLSALRSAAERGVDVRLILPKTIDVPIIKWATPWLYKKLIESQVKVFEFKSSILHTKTLLVDDWGVVGSHNLNYRSVIHDLEAEVVIFEVDDLKRLESFFDTVLHQSEKILNQEYDKLPLHIRLKCRLALWVRYFI